MSGLVRAERLPIIVEAMRIEIDTATPGRHKLDPNTESIARISGWMLGHGYSDFRVHAGPPFGLMLEVLGQRVLAEPGWWVVHESNDVFLPCSPETFIQTYRVIEES